MEKLTAKAQSMHYELLSFHNPSPAFQQSNTVPSICFALESSHKKLILSAGLCYAQVNPSAFLTSMIYQSGLENSGLKSLLSKLIEQEYKLQHLRAMVTSPQHPPESSGAKILHYFSRLQSHIQQWHGNAFPSGLQSLNEREISS